MKAAWLAAAAAFLLVIMSGCASNKPPAPHQSTLDKVAEEPASAESKPLHIAIDPRVGAWRAKVQFATEPWSGITNLEFLYTFNVGGTMTESANYDSAPPVPPAYGIWRRIAPNKYQAKYMFYQNNAPESFDAISSGGGWMPAGFGILQEEITLSEDGNQFTSKLRLDPYDGDDKPIPGGSTATSQAVKFYFEK